MTRSAFSFAALCLCLSLFAVTPIAASAQSLGPTLQKIKDAGTITIDSRPGRTVLQVRIPIQPPQPSR